MDQSFECFLQLPYRNEHVDEESLFPIDLPQAYRPPLVVQGNQKVDENEVIDQQLLLKTSTLHEAKRNKKLLQFELLESKIMKKYKIIKSNQLQQQLSQMITLKSSFQSKGIDIKDDCFRLQRQIENQKKKNIQLKLRIDQTNHEIIRNKHQLSNISNQINIKSLSKMGKKVKEHGYISIEKIRLEGENQSKKEIVQEMKKMIGELKDKISGKELINQELQEEYQNLLKYLEKEGKRLKKRDNKTLQQNDIEIFEQVPTTFRGSSLIDETERSHIEKQNNINIVNAPVQSHSKSLESLKTKHKVKANKTVNSELLKNKKKDLGRKCLKKWIQKGTKSKRLH